MEQNITVSRPEENSPSPNKKNTIPLPIAITIEIIVIFITIVIVYGTLNYFGIISFSRMFPNQLGWLPTKQKSDTVATGMPKIDRSAPRSLPVIDPSARSVNSAIINYIFLADVKSIVIEGSQAKLTLTAPDNTFPELPLTEKTALIKGTPKSPQKLTYENIHEGDRVSVAAAYNLKLNTWTVRQVYNLTYSPIITSIPGPITPIPLPSLADPSPTP